MTTPPLGAFGRKALALSGSCSRGLLGARSVCVLGAMAVALSGCMPAGADQLMLEELAALEAGERETRVELALVEASDAVLEMSLPGEVEGSQDTLLASSQGGYVEAVVAHEGQRVRRGQVLLKVDTSLYAPAVDQARAQRDLAANELQRMEALGDHATASQLDNARTQVAVSEAGLAQAEVRLTRSLIRAPFAGTVADIAVDVGEVASPGAPAVRLVNLDPIHVTLSVSDRDVVTLEPGMPVSVRTNAQAGFFQGTVSHIAPAASLRTRAFPVEVSVPNPDHRLLPGMIARVAVEQPVISDAVVIPQDWVVTRLSDQGVFVEVDGRAQWRSIELGDVMRDLVVVTSGVSPGDHLVITGQRDLVEGDRLIIARQGTCCVNGRVVY